MKQAIFFSLPFFACISTFLFFLFATKKESFPAPSLLGQSITNALIIASEHNLHVRVLEQQEDSTAEPGTVLEQNPAPNQRIKEKQSIFIVVSKAIEPIKAPNLIKQSVESAKKIINNQSYAVKIYYLNSIAPKNNIIAQHPAPGNPLPDNVLIIYASSGKQYENIIMPDLKGKTKNEVEGLLQQATFPITADYIEQKKAKSNAIISHQKPLAGTILPIQERIHCQLELSN